MRRLLLLLLSGCAAQSGMGRARVLDPGQSQLGTSVELQVLAARFGEGAVAPLPWAQAVIGYHRGLSRDVEAGARVWGFAVPGIDSLGAAGDVKVQLARGKDWDVAVGGSVLYHQLRLGGTPQYVIGATVPVLFGHNIGKQNQLVFGPRFADYFLTGEGQNPINTFWFGASVGYYWQIKKDVALMPELSLLYTPISFHGEIADADRKGATSMQLGLGAHFDL